MKEYASIHDAVAFGTLEDVMRLANAHNINEPGYYRHGMFRLTPLHIAVDQRALDKVTYLLERGADVNKCSEVMGTALHIAASKQYTDVARILMRHGASTSLKHKAVDTETIFT